jgi:endogenous inhibitor of DNA gyrase (YacG/DUF329 family)
MNIVLCPTCQRQVPWTEASPWRPFCSERCKLIDLGAWASGQHAIPDSDLAANDDAIPNAGDATEEE